MHTLKGSANASKSGNPAGQVLSIRIVCGGILAAIAASTCCAGPLVLLMLGISGRWQLDR